MVAQEIILSRTGPLLVIVSNVVTRKIWIHRNLTSHNNLTGSIEAAKNGLRHACVEILLKSRYAADASSAIDFGYVITDKLSAFLVVTENRGMAS